MNPVVELARVDARDAGAPRKQARGAISGISVALGPGVHAFLGAPEDGTLALAEVISGARPPLRGRVTVTGRDPATAPFLRARIGALSPEPRLPAARTVRDAVRLAMRARGESGDRFDAVLDPLGLSPLQARAPRSLSFAEERAIELALALSTPAPLLLALHEPLSDVAVPRLDLLPSRLREAAAAGACVVLTTSSPADARALAERVLVLHRGRIAREARGGAGLVLAEEVTLRAWVRDAPAARALSAALTVRAEVRAVSFEETLAEGATVVVRGDRAEACALALTEAALASGAEIEALTEDAPSLGEVRTATETLWKMMQSRPAAMMGGPERSPQTPPAVLSPPPVVAAAPVDDAPRLAEPPPPPAADQGGSAP